MHRRSATGLLALLLALTLMLPALIGCGSGGTAATTGQASSKASGTGSGAPAAASPSGSPGEYVTAPGGGYWLIIPEELQDLLAAEDVVLINVEPKYEAAIEGTDLFIAWDKLPQNLGQIPDRAATIVLYSADGEFSKRGALKLVSFGYTGIHDLDGGMAAWEAAGLELVAGQ